MGLGGAGNLLASFSSMPAFPLRVSEASAREEMLRNWFLYRLLFRLLVGFFLQGRTGGCGSGLSRFVFV